MFGRLPLYQPAERRVAIGQLKQTEEERDVIASELQEEMLMKSVDGALAISEAKTSFFALTVHCLCLQYACTLYHRFICVYFCVDLNVFDVVVVQQSSH